MLPKQQDLIRPGTNVEHKNIISTAINVLELDEVGTYKVEFLALKSVPNTREKQNMSVMPTKKPTRNHATTKLTSLGTKTDYTHTYTVTRQAL